MPIGGVGYLPIKKKLPARDKGNLNEAFLIKCSGAVSMDENQWPNTDLLPNFRNLVEQYASAMTTLRKMLLPIYAKALGMPSTFILVEPLAIQYLFPST